MTQPTRSQIQGQGRYEGKLKRLSEVKSNADMPQIKGAFWVGGHCMLMGAVQTVGEIKGARCLIVGPQACLRNVAMSAEGAGPMRNRASDSGNYYYLLPTGDQDAVLGQDQQIAEAITAIAENEAPPFLFIITTCVQEILGVDVESIVAALGDLSPTHALVVPIDTFTWPNHFPGVERTLSSLAKAMPSPGEKNEAAINILGSRLPGDFGELGEVLTRAGVQSLSAIPSMATSESILRAPEARANIVIEHAGLELARQMKERFGTDYVDAPRTRGLYTTREWYERIGAFLGLELEIEDIFQAAKRRVDDVASVVAGKSFALGVCVPGHTFELARFLTELGMEPKVILLSTVLEQEREHMDVILSQGFDPILVHANRLVIEPLIREIRPDLLVGVDLRFLSEPGMPNVPLMPGIGYYGFEGTVYTVDSIEQSVRLAGPQGARIKEMKP